MRFLVDSDVLSEGTKVEPNPNVMNWLRRHQMDLLVNPIVLGELEFGILKLPDGEKRDALLSWFAQGVQCFNLLDMNAETAGHWAGLLVENPFEYPD